jgi:hypothetical protein
MVMVSEQFKFVWNNEISATSNFHEWYTLNCEERSAYGEKILSREEAVQIFNEMHNVSVDIGEKS